MQKLTDYVTDHAPITKVSIAAEDAEPTTEENGLKRDEEGVAGEEDSSDDDDDDDVKITIGTILNPASAYARPGFGRIPQLPGAGGVCMYF